MIFRFFFPRELKRHPFFFILLFTTLFLGTMGLVGIRVISGQVEGKLRQSAHELLTSDFAVSARRPLSQEEQKALSDIVAPVQRSTYEIIDIYSMVSDIASGASRLSEIRATERGFPFYGEIRTISGSAFDPEKLYVSRDLADVWKTSVGDLLRVGEVTMPVSGIVSEDTSQGLRGFSLAPRIYFPLSRLGETGLIRPGATGSFSRHFKLGEPADASELKASIYKAIKDPAVKMTLPEDSSEQTGRVISVLSNFMALSALIGLVLALVGVFYLYQSHLMARLKDLCLLNLHGLSKLKILLSILAQFSVVFLMVVLSELVLVKPFYRAIAPLLTANFGLELETVVEVSPALGQMPLLYLLSVLILVPLFFGLLRTPMGLQLKSSRISLGAFRFYDFFPFLCGLWLFSCYLARSFKIGNLFFAALLLVFLASTLIVRGAQRLIRKSISGKGLRLPVIENGVALRSLARSGHKLTLSFLSLVMATTLISLVLQLDRMIMKEFALDAKKPSLFLFDIQEEQIGPLTEVARENGTPLAFVTPMIRARLEAVNGLKFVRQKRDYDFRSREEDEEARFRNNSLNLTYRGYLTDAERIVEGEPFPKARDSERLPSVSIEKRWSERMNVKLGDELTFDIQGVEFKARVINIKEVRWTSFYPNFFVTLEPGEIEAAPKTFLAILPPVAKDAKLKLQQRAVTMFSNVSFIDVGELVTKISSLFERSRQAIELISWLSLIVGLVILYGLSHDQVYRRTYDLALMKALGFSEQRLRLNLLCEFGSLFLAALGLGFFLGWLIAQIIGREVFKIPFSVDWSRIFLPALILSFLCLATILLSSWRAVRASPRQLLTDA